MKHVLLALTFAAATVAAPASAFTFFSIGATTGAAPGDPGLASFETPLIDFDGPNHAGITETLSSNAIVYHVNTPNIAAAPSGDTTSFLGIGTGGSATFDFRTYFTGRNVRSVSVYVGSVDQYNHIDVLDTSLHVIGTIDGAQLPGNNGDQGASITNRRLYINFAPSENVGGLTFRSDNVAFEFDTIGASSVVFAPPAAPPVVGAPPVDPAPAVLPAVVPEPAAWLLMIAGFASTGFAARRRRIAVAA